MDASLFERYQNLRIDAEPDYGSTLRFLAPFSRRSYLSLHKKVTAQFKQAEVDFIVQTLRQWYFESQKMTNPAAFFNWKLNNYTCG